MNTVRVNKKGADRVRQGHLWIYQSDLVDVDAEGGSIIRQTAVFDPAGLLGLMYWYGIYPVHRRIFAGMLAGVAARAVNGWY